MRRSDSSYDRRFAGAHQEAVKALEAAGYDVEQPVTGSVIIDGYEFGDDEWSKMLTWDLEDILWEVAERLEE